jgi:hypothetical protein
MRKSDTRLNTQDACDQQPTDWSVAIPFGAPRPLTAEEVQCVAGGPRIVNDGLVPIMPKH